MKTQNISYQPNFQGNVILLNKYGKPAQKRLTKELTNMGADLDGIKALIKDKPYDLYLAEKDTRDPWLMRVGTTPKQDPKYNHYVAKTLSVHLKDIIQEFIEKHYFH